MPSPTSSAALVINSVVIDDVATAAVSIQRSSIDTTALGASGRSYEQGFLEGSISCEVLFDASHDTITNALKNATSLTAASVRWATGKTISGNAIVQDMSLSVAPNGVAQATFTLLFIGTVTVTN